MPTQARPELMTDRSETSQTLHSTKPTVTMVRIQPVAPTQSPTNWACAVWARIWIMNFYTDQSQH
ncbi:Hermansky-Pudlak syndrome 3 protein [Clarias magur]|uniref:Hermansky-Pudlak syndrome 3 protein n=1 Tax=Clarias magur TaxID=1594786 RepID=A0A8J4URC3_CLAMG|nr:Hermansky-Pudlak syndrome 3 protein [Clarias magur]